MHTGVPLIHIRQTPNRIMLGREGNLPVDIIFPHPREKVIEVDDCVENLSLKMERCSELARKQLKVAAENKKEIIKSYRKSHFDGFNLRPSLCKCLKISPSRSMCSWKPELKIIMSSRYMSIAFHCTPRNTSSMHL